MARNTNTPTKAQMEKMIAEYQAKLDAAEAEAKKASPRKAARDQAKAKADSQVSYAERKAAKNAQVQEEFGHLVGHFCTVTGGRKIDHGTQVECYWVGVNRHLGAACRIKHKGELTWFNPSQLEAGKPLPKEKVASYEAAREAEAEEEVVAIVNVIRETEGRGDTGGAIVMYYSGWAGPISFPKSLVEKRGITKDGQMVYALPAWKVRKDCGPAMVEFMQQHEKAAIDAIATE